MVGVSGRSRGCLRCRQRKIKVGTIAPLIVQGQLSLDHMMLRSVLTFMPSAISLSRSVLNASARGAHVPARGRELSFTIQ
jgi:hypothetical protein